MRLWNFNRLGGIALHFDIHKYGLQFVSAVLGFLWLNKEQLGFDPTIITVRDKRYIEIKRDNGPERLVIDKVIKRGALRRWSGNNLLESRSGRRSRHAAGGEGFVAVSGARRGRRIAIRGDGEGGDEYCEVLLP
jgi:hypothetical protein